MKTIIAPLISKVILLLSLFILVISANGISQTPGLIYKPAASVLGRSVLDPNGDGFVSSTASGFSGTDYGASSELNMVALPVIGGEPTGDITTGSAGGHTDIVSVGGNSNQSCYLLYKQVSGVNYLIIRFRIGSASTSSKGYSFLLDTDGIFGTLLSSNNPGYDKEVVMETGNSGRIAVYNHDVSGTTLSTSYNLDEYHQRSVALSTESGNADYFYDFFIPYSALGLTSEPVRISAVTVTSAGSGITGSKSDYNGVNDQLYGNDPIAIANALMNSFPSTPLTSLSDGYVYAAPKSTIPVVNAGITTSSTSISGTSRDVNGTIITVYKNGVSIGTTTVSSNTWTLSGISGLSAGNLITAKATATDKTISDVSASIEVTVVQSCYTNPPVIIGRTTNQTITGTWSGGITSNGSNVRIRLYNQVDQSTISEIASGVTVYVLADGTWSYTTGLSQNDFNGYNILATATVVSSSCISAYSNVSKKESGNVNTIGIVTPTPSITTTLIYASTGARNVVVANNGTTAVAALLKIYVNGVLKETTVSTVAINGTYTFSLTGLIDGDIITARAQGTGTTPYYWLSSESNVLTVLASSVTTTAPVISGSYISSSTAVSGTSVEAAGTVISVYKNGMSIGSTTVNAFGTWTLSGLTLTANDILTAKAKATGELLSSSSNSLTVAASAPSAPVISGTYQTGASSVSGTGANGVVTIYVDGSSIGTVTATGNWSLTGIVSGTIYKGAIVTATNTASGIESVLSNAVVVTGVNSFLITNTSNGSVGAQVAGVAFNIKLTAKDGASGSGNTVTSFTGKVVISSTSTILAGAGQTSNFSTGVLNLHSINLTTAGSNKTITAVSQDDPTAIGVTTIDVINPASVNKLVLSSPLDVAPGTRASYTISRKDAYDNNTTTGAITVYLTASGLGGSFYNASSGGSVITSVAIADGQSSASFWFVSNAGGLYAITSSDASPADGNYGLLDATDEIFVGTIWTGSTSTDWATSTNWEGNSVPSLGADIVIPAGRLNYPILDQARTIGGIYMGTGATTRLNGFTLTIGGVFSGSGKFIGSSNAALVINGTGSAGTLIFDQTTPGTSNYLNTLTFNRTSTGLLLLGSNLSVGTINLTNGIIDIAASTITSAVNNGGSVSSYIRTSGDGFLKTNIGVTNAVAFPVGNSTFNPVTITNKTASSDDFSVQVIDEVYQNGNGKGNSNTITSPRIKRTWEISKSNPTANSGNGVDFSFSWNVGEQLSDISSYSLYHYTGGKWNHEVGNVQKVPNENKMLYTGYKGSFSPFSITDGNAVLPVSLVNLDVQKSGKNVSVKWKTAGEQNSKDFLVQHSVDGRDWKSIGTVLASGESSKLITYEFIHTEPRQNNFYRLVQHDIDGKSTLSKVVTINIIDLDPSLKVLGNPVVNGSLKLLSTKNDTIKLYSLSGKMMAQRNIPIGSSNQDISTWPKGVYILTCDSQSMRIVVQ